ncbi:MAG: Holliday junction branch migration DNA helicase RuvB, partial [Planctomycetes bacterium]|nr:Holliday junction branch migration DNA helicase RuvB [Planctomycetota bacterium]
NARSVRLSIPRFTLVGATTRIGLLTAPLRNRFTLQTRLDYYGREDMLKIVKRSCKLLEVETAEEGAIEIAKRARGTPRIANRLLKRVRDYAQVKGTGVLSKDIVENGLKMEQIDPLGLDELDRSFLRALITVYEGGPAGIEAIAATLGEERDTLEDVVEPYLLQIGFVRRTKRGREVTPQARTHVGLA